MMTLLLQQIANGLVIGSTYAVVALGFSLAFTVLRVINFAHPDIFMVGMFAGLVFGVPGPWGFVAALAAGKGSIQASLRDPAQPKRQRSDSRMQDNVMR